MDNKRYEEEMRKIKHEHEERLRLLQLKNQEELRKIQIQNNDELRKKKLLYKEELRRMQMKNEEQKLKNEEELKRMQMKNEEQKRRNEEELRRKKIQHEEEIFRREEDLRRIRIQHEEELRRFRVLLNQNYDFSSHTINEEILKKLNKYIFNNDKKDKDGNIDKIICCICLNDIKINEEVVKLPCNHIHHWNCCINWLKCKHNCPMCRFEIK